MTVEEIIAVIDRGGHTSEEWLQLRDKILKEMKKLTKEDREILEVSEVMESLSMVCRAIEGER